MMPLALLGNPYVLIGIMVALLASHATAYWYGSHNAGKTCTIEKAEMVREAQVKQNEELQRAHDQSTKLEAAHAKTRMLSRQLADRSRTLNERTDAQELCFDADRDRDRLLLINEALTRKAAPTGKPDAAVPRSNGP